MKIPPVLSVLLPAYNAQKYINETVDSILNQTFQDFELIIIDDCSTDNTNELIAKYRDPRIRLIKNEENLKLIKTLNKGIKIAKGKYLARIDADDVCLPTRFEKQVRFFSENPEVAVLGTDIEFIDRDSRWIGKGVTHPKSNFEIVWGFYRRACLYHPTVMVNLEVLKNDFYYDENYPYAEDYELWMRLGKKYKLANLDEALVRYRVHEESVTQSFTEESVKSTLKAIKEHSELGVESDFFLEYIKFPNRIKTDSDIENILSIWLRYYQNFIEKNHISQDEKLSIQVNAMSFVLIISGISLVKFLHVPSGVIKEAWELFDFNFSKLLKLMKSYLRNVYYRVFIRILKKVIP